MTDRDYELMREERDNALDALAAEREKVKGLERDKNRLIDAVRVVLFSLRRYADGMHESACGVPSVGYDGTLHHYATRLSSDADELEHEVPEATP